MPKKPIRKKTTRNYDLSSRLEKTTKVRVKIIEAYVRLLGQKRGIQVEISEISKLAKISERTIYRLFNDKASLAAATNEYVQEYIVASSKQLAVQTVPEFAKYVFAQFDRYEDLVLAYLYSSLGVETRATFRRKFNRLIIDKILAGTKMTLTKEREVKLAVITSLINAKIWDEVRVDYGLRGEEIGVGVSNAIQLLIDDL